MWIELNIIKIKQTLEVSDYDQGPSFSLCPPSKESHINKDQTKETQKQDKVEKLHRQKKLSLTQANVCQQTKEALLNPS